MPSYIGMLKWTAQGIQNVKQSPARLEAARKVFEAAGAKMKEFYMVTGHYDLIVVAEAPDYTTMAKAILGVTASGNLTSETCRAFTEAEYREIVGALP